MKVPFNIKYKVDVPVLKQEILRSMAKKNTPKVIERNLRVQKGELLTEKIKRAKRAELEAKPGKTLFDM